MAKKVVITCDSTADLGNELYARYQIDKIIPLHICYGDKSFDDGINIAASEVFKKYEAEKVLPTTAAVSVGEYLDAFKPFIDDGCEVVHINIGSGLSCSHSNARLAAEQIGGGVYVIDSQNLSTGMGLVVLEAAERRAQGMEAAQIAEEVNALVSKCHASFILDTLKFLAAGGRCSAVVALGANLLKIKPSIEVNNQGGGAMGVAKKYRGELSACVVEYVKDQLAKYDNINKKRIFITHSGVDAKIVEQVKKMLVSQFDEVFVTVACCTISSHCGPNCIGVLFETE